MRNPAIYLALVGFILFFSNASIGFLALSQTNNKFFLDTLAANNLVNALYAKTPLLVNIHISNINRFADGQPIKNFLQETYS